MRFSKRGPRILRGAPRSLVVLTLLAATLGGCLGSVPGTPLAPDPSGDTARAAPVPADVQWNTEGPFSLPLDEGPFGVLPVELNLFESFDGIRISTAVWRPDVPPDHRVPVVLDVGPYFGDEILEPMGGMDLRFLVSHGIAFGHMSVRGTGGSGGCQEFFSTNEQRDIDAAITYYGTQAWSNGNVGLIGISYDGTTAWIGATFGNPHLKTIVPISGLTDIYEHSFRNGTPAAYAPAIHAVYWSYGWQTQSRGPEDYVANAACPEAGRGLATGSYSTVTGEPASPPPFDDYWAERNFRTRMVENYRGSVFLVQGLQDWRVPPHMAFPLMGQLQAQGVETKMLLGQWWHDVPDNVERGYNVRFDYAETLLRWFQRELVGDESVDTGPAVETQDSLNLWRTEENWPPADAQWSTLHLGDGTLEADATPAGEVLLWGPGNAKGAVTSQDGVPLSGTDAQMRSTPVEYEASTPPLAEELRIAGLPRLHATFAPNSPEGARIYAQLIDRSPAGEDFVVGHAVMDLRYHEGGHERRSLEAGEPIVARMQFYPLDVAIPTGHELVLRVMAGSGYSEERLAHDPSGVLDQFIESPTPLPTRLDWGEGASVLELPVIERDVGDGTYLGQP